MSSRAYIVPTTIEKQHFNSWDDLLNVNVDDVTTPLERLKTVMQKYTAKHVNTGLLDLNFSNGGFRNVDNIISITQSMGRMNRHGTADRIPITINRFSNEEE